MEQKDTILLTISFSHIILLELASALSRRFISSGNFSYLCLAYFTE